MIEVPIFVVVLVGALAVISIIRHIAMELLYQERSKLLDDAMAQLEIASEGWNRSVETNLELFLALEAQGTTYVEVNSDLIDAPGMDDYDKN